MRDYHRHVIKHDYENGRKIAIPVSWCGHILYSFDKPFINLQHALLSIEQENRLLPCPECLKAAQKIIGQYFETVNKSSCSHG